MQKEKGFDEIVLENCKDSWNRLDTVIVRMINLITLTDSPE